MREEQSCALSVQGEGTGGHVAEELGGDQIMHRSDLLEEYLGRPRLWTTRRIGKRAASVRPDPRTRFAHQDGICLYILEYDRGSMQASAWDDVWSGPAREGAGSDIAIHSADVLARRSSALVEAEALV